MTWTNLNKALHEYHSFLITSHLNPDGDCIGSQLALYWYLTSLGKHVIIYNYDPVPEKFSFLTNTEHITTESPQETFDVQIVLDSSNPDRLGWDLNKYTVSCTINIDHHLDNTRFGDVNLVDDTAPATADIIYRYFTEQGISLPDHVAEALYTAIMTDTGGFRFNNTTSQVLRTCADLAGKGVDCSHVYNNSYVLCSPGGALLRSKIISTLSFHLNNTVCSMNMPLHLIKEMNATYGDSEGMADYTMNARGVEVGILLKHKPGETHFSLRSAGRIDVGKIARSFPGGGGHAGAAGCTFNISMPEAMTSMLEVLEKEINR